MTTSMGLLVVLVLLASGGWVLLRGTGSGKPAAWRKLVLATLVGIVAVFLLWLTVMVLMVGPHMRTI
jgi:hypothetical protein